LKSNCSIKIRCTKGEFLPLQQRSTAPLREIFKVFVGGAGVPYKSSG
jgi:hypothetical protein